MLAKWAADGVVLLHLGFIAFVLLGGLLVLRSRRLLWPHVAAVAWGALIEFTGWVCPLTPLEIMLRRSAGESGYAGGFVEQYVVPLIYPGALTRQLQVALGLAVLLLNAFPYGLLWRRAAASRRSAAKRGATLDAGETDRRSAP
jgi:Protein of Unknown function (DUF2784)